jgi:hypothetical protein
LVGCNYKIKLGLDPTTTIQRYNLGQASLS